MILNSKYNFLKPYKVNKLKRYGRKFDGGYLVCEDAIKNINNCITLGVGDDISFEIDLECGWPIIFNTSFWFDSFTTSLFDLFSRNIMPWFFVGSCI